MKVSLPGCLSLDFLGSVQDRRSLQTESVESSRKTHCMTERTFHLQAPGPWLPVGADGFQKAQKEEDRQSGGCPARDTRGWSAGWDGQKKSSTSSTQRAASGGDSAWAARHTEAGSSQQGHEEGDAADQQHVQSSSSAATKRKWKKGLLQIP